MSDSREEDNDLLHGLEAVSHADDADLGDSRLPFDPRYYGPGDLYRDVRAWIHRYRIYLGIAVVLGVAGYFHYDVSIEVPPWIDVLLPAAAIAAIIGYGGGIRLGEWFARPRFRVVSQLDAKDGDLDLIKISLERWRDMTVLDHQGDERPRSYLKDVVINGESAVEVDRYYPSRNLAIASWQAGASNADLREWERKVDRVKTDLEEEATQAIEARVNADEQARKQASEVSNYVLATVEGVLNPGEGDLAERLQTIEERDEHETHEEVLAGLEDDLRRDARRDEVEEEEPDPSEELKDRATAIVEAIDPRGSDSDSSSSEEGSA